MRALLPPGVRRSGRRRVMLAARGAELLASGGGEPPAEALLGEARSEAQREVLAALAAETPLDWRRLRRLVADDRSLAAALESLRRRELVRVEAEYGPSVNPRVITVLDLRLTRAEALSASEGMARVAPSQARVLRWLAANGLSLSAAELARRSGSGEAAVRALVQRGLLAARPVEVARDPQALRPAVPGAWPEPTPHQAAALEQVRRLLARERPGAMLVFGVTGSGKTEIYLRAIETVLARGRQAVVLVPEIALTPQMIGRFRSRFGEQVAVLHSRLGAGERFDEWRKIKQGRAAVAVGARSAIFAPFTRLGLIVLDEEHETTYKQEDNPRYHAREVAEYLADRHGALLLLGSATPSLETYHRASSGELALAELPERINRRPLPPVKIVDLRAELQAGNRSVLSRYLQERLQTCLERGQQAILFLNRRGYSTFVLCRSCGAAMKCPDCDVSLTLHGTAPAAPGVLQCHYCGYREAVPAICPVCGSKSIRHFGSGTERVEEELREHFPRARVLRMDVDTTRTKGAHERILDHFARGEADVLVGTQMVAKGLDFPRVTLVGVIAADVALNFPDFRAAERTFQLLTQVSGRSGRGADPGEVVVQTYNPEHYSVQAAQRHDFMAFCRHELPVRQGIGYPPFSHLVNFVVWGTEGEEVSRAAHWVVERLRSDGDPTAVIGPAPAPIARLRGHFRWRALLLEAEGEPALRRARSVLRAWEATRPRGDLRLTIDVNPLSML